MSEFNMLAHLLYYHRLCHKVPKEKLEGLSDYELRHIHDVIHGWTSPKNDFERSLRPRPRMPARRLP